MCAECDTLFVEMHTLSTAVDSNDSKCQSVKKIVQYAQVLHVRSHSSLTNVAGLGRFLLNDELNV